MGNSQTWSIEKTIYKLSSKDIALYGQELENARMIKTSAGDEYYQWENNSIHFDGESPKSSLGAWNKLLAIIKNNK